ncbi:hypothetical protein C8R45DRAFT_1105123 [Mycena sanguinolenta]|nr:hypothetical protein C8R45DRAFT_1105123 [Mycena sanguinolenta]
MSFTTLLFNSSKILNSRICGEDDPHLTYTTCTIPNRTSRQTTSLQGSPARSKAIIDWTRHTFEVHGRKREIEQLSSKRGTFSSSRYWSWFAADEYRVKWASEMENTWTVYSYDGSVLATFTPKIRRMFHDNVMPVLKLSPSVVDEDEGEFIMLILLYSETKRREKRRLSVFRRRR